jgi:hypothetical protein
MQSAHENLIYLLLGVLSLSFLIQVYYYLVVYLRLPLYKATAAPGETRPVSVILCAKNELDNLQKYLPRFLVQDYPDYEVVVVNEKFGVALTPEFRIAGESL